MIWDISIFCHEWWILCQRFCTAKETVPDILVGTFTTTKSYFLLLDQDRFVVCEKVSVRFSGCSSIACGSIPEASFQSRVEDRWELEKGWSKKDLCKVDGSTCVKRNGWYLNCTGGTFPMQSFLLHKTHFSRICTSMKRYLKSAGTFMFLLCNNNTSRSDASTACTWNRS